VRQTETWVRYFTAATPSPWRPTDEGDGKIDAAQALIRIFGRMAVLVIERLNRAPEKNFLAFLNLIGTQPLPPQSARVPLTFELASASPTAGFVPARTPVAALPQAGDVDEVVFETEREVAVTPARLTAVWVHEPAADRYADYTSVALSDTDEDFPAFSSASPSDHSLYLAQDELLALPHVKTAVLTLESPAAPVLANLAISWFAWDGSRWQPVEANSAAVAGRWQVSLSVMPVAHAQSVDGQEARWLRGRLNTPLPATGEALPVIDQATLHVQGQAAGLTPDHALVQGQPLNLTVDFYPFGEQPRRNDAFYLASEAALARPNAEVSLHIELSEPQPLPLQPSADLALAWEVWDGQGWRRLTPTGQAQVMKLLASGTITFILPVQLGPTQVNGITAYWLRARIVAGDYGVAPSSEWDESRQTLVTQGGYGPPSLARVRLDYRYQATAPIALCKTHNHFNYTTHEAPFTPFILFVPAVDTQPALYLGFDRSFDNRPTSLYVQVAPATPAEQSAWYQAVATSGSTRLVWEYASANSGWQPLGAVDETQRFSVSGMVEFLGPADFSLHRAFGQTRYWLRVRQEGEPLAFIPRLKGLLINTTWASQGVTLENEMLGSSNGEPKQTFRSAYAPVLLQPAVSLQVREPEPSSVQKHLAVTAGVSADAVAARQESNGRHEGAWVTWRQVADFHGSTPQDRHYLLDHLTGAVSFGDGQQGRVPPRGRDNIRLQRYRSGGGAHGNRPAATITQLKTTLPYVAAVSNPEAASGGADAEALERVVERGPKTLRHRHRAVTAQDLEDLAFEASPAVARARAITPLFNPVELPWRPLFHLNITQPGEIKVELDWQDSKPLAIALYGPGQGSAYGQVQGASPLRLSYTVESTRFQPGERWWVAVTNTANEYVNGVSLKLAYPVGMLDSSFQVPPQDIPEVTGAGRSELIIVPQASGSRPMPSPRLLRQVEAYVRARCGADMALRVREPHWLEVTVAAQVIVAPGHNTDSVHVAVVAELTRFLHPLSGAKTGRGWPFGRLPQRSDVYSLLESVPGVDHVRSLSILQPEVAPPERQWFLIFSGQHRISMGISGRL
jgi:hypothetical protein